jgi:serine/threonine protein kinase
MHSKGIAHLDIKSENILVDPSDYTLKICDFGLAQCLTCNNGKLNDPLGTEGYISPQIVERVPYLGEAADLFAAAVSLMVCRNGKPPFSHASKTDQLY